MFRRMTDKLGHLAHSQPKTQLLAEPLPVAQTNSALTPSLTSAEHRGSISTQRTSESESSKLAESVHDLKLAEALFSPHQRRPKGTYRLTDFYFQRTLGTGSFGRVHLGEFSGPAF